MPRVLGALCQEPENKDQIHIFFIFKFCRSLEYIMGLEIDNNLSN